MANNRTIYTTAKGTAIYPHLRTPEVFEGNEIGYTLKVMFSKEDADKLADFLNSKLEEVKKMPEFANKKNWKNASIGMSEDDDGNIIFKFKKAAHITARKTGKEFETTVPIYDSNGVILDKTVDPSGGSVVRVAYSIYPFNNGSMKGLSLRLEAVQVIELKVWTGGNADAASFGFGTVEGGFVAPPPNEEGTPFDETEEDF